MGHSLFPHASPLDTTWGGTPCRHLPPLLQIHTDPSLRSTLDRERKTKRASHIGESSGAQRCQADKRKARARDAHRRTAGGWTIPYQSPHSRPDRTRPTGHNPRQTLPFAVASFCLSFYPFIAELSHAPIPRNPNGTPIPHHNGCLLPVFFAPT